MSHCQPQAALPLTRREALAAAAALLAGPISAAAADDDKSDERPSREQLERQVGLTTGSLMRHLSAEEAPDKVRLIDLPRIMNERLGMQVIDLMTACVPSFEPDYLDRFRAEAEDHDCVITNLKMNQRGLDLGSRDETLRNRSLEEYKSTIDSAARLGCRWVRPLPAEPEPDEQLLVDGFRRLIDYAVPHEISLLIENFGWLKGDPEAIPRIIEAVGEGLTASPDTGNWTNEARYDGLAKAFPHAVTCDFKAFELGDDGTHARYDLQRCFTIGWEAGFRGPWCLEHFNTDLDPLLDELVLLRDMLQQWMREAA